MLIAQITDIHLGFEPGNPAEFNRQRLDRNLARLASLDPLPDLLLATGDLIDRGDRESYARLREAFASCPFPVHMALGNHDLRENFAAEFPDPPLADGFLQYVIEGKPLRIVVIDTLEEGRHGGAFCAARARWLMAQLDAEPVQPTLIVLHHPPVEVGIAWMNTHPHEAWVGRLAGCLRGRRNVIGMVCGHIHRAVTTLWEELCVAICPSTAPQVALDLRPIDPARPDGRDMIIAEPPGYALHWWNGRELISHFDNAESYLTLARYDDRMQPLVQSLLDERPG